MVNSVRARTRGQFVAHHTPSECLRTGLRRSRTGLCILRRETVSRRRRRAVLRRGNHAPARSQRRKRSETAALSL